MTASKAKGTRYETEMAEFFTRALGYRVERRALKGNRDEGDLILHGGWVAELKNEKTLRLGDYLDELRVEMRNANAELGVVLVKRRGKGPIGSYALLPMEVLLRLLPHNTAPEVALDGVSPPAL